MTKRKGRMLISGRNSMSCIGLRYGGCSCHNTKQSRRKAVRIAKRREERQERRQLERDY
jgi:hypothetical protein